jgi:hypothetical protein
VLGERCATSRKVAGSIPMRSLNCSIYLILPVALWSWGRLSLWQKWVPGIFLGIKGGRPARKADNLTAICEPIVRKMWEPRRLINLWASASHYRDSFLYLTELWALTESASENINRNRHETFQACGSVYVHQNTSFGFQGLESSWTYLIWM